MAATYPVRVDAALDSPLSRWRWLIKWLLALPHYVVLAFLWIAFVALSCCAFVAILVTGRYPRAIFEFNVGVLRWTWRVHYYTFGALGTDRYPPFTLSDVGDYPAHLEIAYPGRLSRGLVLVKWWLLAIPHYLVVGVFLGGGWLAWQADNRAVTVLPGGLIGLLVLIAAVVLAVTGRYPRQIYDFVLGMNRWALRVAAYVALMTDDYPPFRLDMGGHESEITLGIDTPAQSRPRSGWTGWRVTSVVIGSVVGLVALGALAGGGTALWLDGHRDGGYVTSGAESHHSDGYAITSDRITLDRLGGNWARDLLGTVRIRARGPGDAAVFVGVAPARAASRYLRDVPRTTLRDLAGARTTTVPGDLRPAAPGTTDIWVAAAAGAGRQTLTWSPREGDWTVVVMNADAARGVSVTADIGATVPDLQWIGVGVVGGGLMLLAAAALLVAVPVRRASGPRT